MYTQPSPYPSKLLERAVEEFAQLPGVGHKTALRFAMHVLRQDVEQAKSFGDSIIALRRDTRKCAVCHNLSDTETCEICSAPRRDRATVCVVQDARDVMAIEATQQYRGVYHVLGGVISPLDGIGPADLNVDSLVRRVAQGGVQEVILALSPTLEGDTTNYYLYKKLAPAGARVTVIARGIAQNDELQYADELTLGRSIVNRTEYRTPQA